MTRIVTRPARLNRAAWDTLAELVRTFDEGGSFQDVAERARLLLERRRRMERELRRRVETEH